MQVSGANRSGLWARAANRCMSRQLLPKEANRAWLGLESYSSPLLVRLNRDAWEIGNELGSS